jgi:uncharacterized membrane protein
MAINETVMSQIANAGFFWMMWPLFMFLMLVAVLVFALWLYMIVDCAKRQKFKHGDRVLWILLLVLTGIIGMILYYFMEMHDS